MPYVSAIVDLDGGGTVKGNLTGVDPDPAKIKMGMPVRVVYKDALGRKDREGNSYLSLLLRTALTRNPTRSNTKRNATIGATTTRFPRSERQRAARPHPVAPEHEAQRNDRSQRNPFPA